MNWEYSVLSFTRLVLSSQAESHCRWRQGRRWKIINIVDSEGMEFKNEEDTRFFLQENIMTLVTRLSVRWFRIIESELNDEKQENIGNRSIISFSSLTRKGERGGGEREGNPAWRISLFAIKLCSIAIRRLQDYTCWNSENVVACCLLYSAA